MKKFLEHPVVATVVGGLILTIIGWIFGLLPTVWDQIKVGASWLFNTLANEFNIPIWLLLLLAGSVLYVIIRQSRIISETKDLLTQSQTKIYESWLEEPPEKVVVPTLSDEEMNLLRFLIKKDGAPSNFGELCRRLNKPKLQIEQMLEALERVMLVEVHENYFHGPQIILTKVGRDHVLGNKFDRA